MYSLAISDKIFKGPAMGGTEGGMRHSKNRAKGLHYKRQNTDLMLCHSHAIPRVCNLLFTGRMS